MQYICSRSKFHCLYASTKCLNYAFSLHSPVQSSQVHRVQGVLVQMIHYLVHTTQVSPFPLENVSHGSIPHCTPIGYRTECQVGELPFVISGAWSTQMAKLRFLLSLANSPVRYPEYSLVQPIGQLILAGIIIDLVRPGTSQTAHGAGRMLSALPPLLTVEKTSLLPIALYTKPYDAPQIDPISGCCPSKTLPHCGSLCRHRKLAVFPPLL